MTKETELSCDCKGWIYNKKCKHIAHVNHHGGGISYEPIEL